jgi:sec-independent protein translocase protein TatB
VFDIGSTEFIGLAIVALIVFGPERLPKLASDAGRFVRQARQLVTGAKRDLRKDLGPDFTDLGLRDLTPRGVIRRTLLDPVDRSVEDLRADLDNTEARPPRRGAYRPLEPGERAPYDSDTT